MAAHGTTTVEAKSGYGLSLDSEIKSLEAIQQATRQWPGTVVATLLGAHVPPPEYRDYPDEYVRIVCEEMIPEAAQRGLAEYVDVFCERGAFTAEQSIRILQRRRRRTDSKTRAPRRPAHPQPALERLRRVPPRSASITWTTSADADIAALARIPPSRSPLCCPPPTISWAWARFRRPASSVDSGVAVASGDRLQPWHLAHHVHALCAVGRLHPHEHVSRRSHHSRDDQRRMRTWTAGPEGKPRAAARDADIAVFDASDYRELPYWFGVNRCWKTLLNGREFRVARW